MKIAKILKASALSAIILMIFLPSLAWANTQTFDLNVPIGNLDSITVGNNSNFIGEYISAWYGFLLGTIGILAAIMIMWGGFKYLTSRGDKGVIDKAKETIISAITGVVLAFGTYTLLSLISPRLLEIKTPNLASIQGGENLSLPQAGIGEGESSTNVVPTGGTANGQLNAPGLQPLTTQLNGDLNAVTGASPTPNGGYRPNDATGYHRTGQATDFPRNAQTNEFFGSLIEGQTPVAQYDGQPIYQLDNVTLNGHTYEHLTIINEYSAANNCWHIDTMPRVNR